MATLNFTYESCLEASERVYWRMDEVLPKTARFDLSSRLLPDSLSAVNDSAFLNDSEKLKLSQIRGHSYLYLFGFVEEYIIGLATQHATAQVFGNEVCLRALLRFAEEEAKHQMLFKRACSLFCSQFGASPGTIANPEAVAGVILANTPMAVLLITLHLEIMTQQHYVESVRDGNGTQVDPLFREILKHHWMEEAQHAKLDMLELMELAAAAKPAQLDQAATEYAGILGALRGLLDQQAEHDVSSLEAACNRTFTAPQRQDLLRSQKRAYAQTFIGLPLDNPQLLQWLSDFSVGCRDLVKERQPALLQV